MPGRHQLQPSRSRLRWLAGLSGGSVVAAVLLALTPTSANASSDPVKATFSVTGVSTSNCQVSAGGSDVWVKPGQELDVNSSFLGVELLNGLLKLNLLDLRGNLTVDPDSKNPIKVSTTAKDTKLPDLSTGNHAFSWKVTNVLGLPLKLSTQAASAGADLNYTGTIHVSDKAANCGIAVQVPGVGVSASVTHLPTVSVSLPGVKVTVPVNVPSLPTKLPSLPSLPHIGGSSSSSAPAAGGSSTSAGGDELPVPARVVPKGDGQAIGGGGGGYVSGLLPGSTGGGGGTNLIPAAPKSSTSAAAPVLQQDSTGKHKTIDLAASKADSTGQFSVILAIVAIIALSVVAATYARLYLLRRSTPTA